MDWKKVPQLTIIQKVLQASVILWFSFAVLIRSLEYAAATFQCLSDFSPSMPVQVIICKIFENCSLLKMLHIKIDLTYE